jgi:hypothetical protein
MLGCGIVSLVAGLRFYLQAIDDKARPNINGNNNVNSNGLADALTLRLDSAPSAGLVCMALYNPTPRTDGWQ